MFEISIHSILLFIIVWIYFFTKFYTNGESCQGAFVENGTNQTIVDQNNETWIITSSSTINKNGQPAGYSGGVIMLVYWNETVYQENNNNLWWKWINNGWVAESNIQVLAELSSASGCSFTTLSDSSTLMITTTMETSYQRSMYFAPHSCNDANYIGDSCNISTKTCDIVQPCQNSNCTDNSSLFHGYFCICIPDFTGTNCESNIRLCQSNTCLYNGTCVEVNRTNFLCDCTPGRTGIHCEDMINYCQKATCFNNGICRPLSLGYKCECLSGSSGDHCEFTSTSIIFRQYFAKSFTYIVIIILSSVAGFIVVLDILKYVFDIDITQKERNRIWRRRIRRKKNSHLTRRFGKTLFPPKPVDRMITLHQLRKSNQRQKF